MLLVPRWSGPLKLLLLCLPVASAAAHDGSTTRIEPRPVYGATVTMERGVRVFRPLPAARNVIINPGQTTPVYLGFDTCPGYAHRDQVSPRGCR